MNEKEKYLTKTGNSIKTTVTDENRNDHLGNL